MNLGLEIRSVNGRFLDLALRLPDDERKRLRRVLDRVKPADAGLIVRTAAHSVMIFDDIHWSEGMQSAWKRICGDPRVMLSIDLFSMGMAFFNPSFRVKQHFRIRF
mgnify:CR=1 FL=1